MDFIDNNATFSIYNYVFPDTMSFKNEFQNSDTCKEISTNFEEQAVKIKVSGYLPPNLKIPSPIIVFANGTCQIIYDDINKKIDITSSNYKEDKDTMTELLMALSQFKLQEISYITNSFSSKCNNHRNRLNVFNENINVKLSNWEDNVGFDVRIPIQVQEEIYSEDYRISKYSGSENEDYIYNVFAIYEYKFIEDKANLMKRLEKLDLIRTKRDELYNKFTKKCEEIMSL